LLPERGKNAEIGLNYASGAHTFAATYFDNQIRGYITATTRPENIPRVRIDGFSLNYEGQFGPWVATANLESLDPRNARTGQVLARRAKQQISAGLRYAAGALSGGLEWLRVGQRTEFVYNFNTNANDPVALKAYNLLDAQASYPVSNDWALQARLRNLTNAKYETAVGYNQAPRSLYLTVRYTPKF
jgi:vitamin B12 transporter